MSTESMFRFIAVRQPPKVAVAEKPPAQGRTRVSVDLHDKPETDLQRKIKGLVSANQGSDARALAAEAKKNGQLLNTLDGLDGTVVAALDWIQTSRGAQFKDLDIATGIKTATGKELAALVAAGEWIAARQKLEDSLVIGATLGETTAANSLAVEALKAMKIIEGAANATLNPQGTLTVSEMLSASTVIVPSPARGDLGSQTVPPVVTAPPPRIEAVDHDALKARFNTLKLARDDLATQLRGNGALKVTMRQIDAPANPGGIGGDKELAARVEQLTHSNTILATALKEQAPAIASFVPHMPFVQTPGDQASAAISSSIAISPTALGRMKAENLKVLMGVVGGNENLSPVRTMAQMDRELQAISSTIMLPEAQSMYVRFAGGYIDKSLLWQSAGFGTYKPFIPSVVAQCHYEVGVADLLLVKQTLKAYELADFAHVENALRGELREREHRRLNIQEETTAFESEREVERERNLQSTERNEMQAEAAKQLKTDAGVQAGLQVSGSYGPTVSFSASLNASFSTSVQESQRKATSFSREVTEKTSERVRERVREERRKRVLEQIEELNRHKIDNTVNPKGHLRGIYRWLNKVYDAQVLNYGKRMMYEFVLPEPAAFLIYTLIEHPPVDATLPPKPEPPTYSGTPLKPENLTQYNYQRYVAQYHITNAPPPPSEFKMIAHFDKLDGQQDPATFGRAAKMALPDDYEAFGAYVNRYYVFPQGTAHALKIVIGGNAEDIGASWGARYVDFNEPFRGEISITYGGFGLRAFGLGVDVFCGITEEGFAKWQQKAYDAIIEGYERMRGDYEEKLAASKIAQGVQIIGRNPLENRRMERDELKKWIVMILRGSPYLNIDSFLPSSEPAMDIDKVCKNGKLIRFLENAFEWHNMSYICYPYFWGRHSRWSAALHFTDPDPDFAEFLKAGAARVQVPVRPGFETAIAHFCDTGAIPDGEATLVGGSMYVPIVQEITESLGKLDDGVPYPEGSQPWEVRVPTSLVVVQDLEEISGIRDVLTGNPIKLLPTP
jgi:hypothetical protein